MKLPSSCCSRRRQQSLESGLDIANRPDGDWMSPPDMRGIDLDLNDRRLARVDCVQAKSTPSRSSTSQSRMAW